MDEWRRLAGRPSVVARGGAWGHLAPGRWGTPDRALSEGSSLAAFLFLFIRINFIGHLCYSHEVVCSL